MPYEITVFGVNTGAFLSVATKSPAVGTKVSLYPQSTTPSMRKKWNFNSVVGGTQIALNSNPALVIATVTTPTNGTSLQLVSATPVTPESLFIAYSMENATAGSYIVSADPAASTAFFIDNSGNYSSGPAHMWTFHPSNQNWMITDVDSAEEP